jgi:hypothetical protein
MDEIRPGDVVLVSGTGALSRLIRLGTRSPWSHAAMVASVGADGEARIWEVDWRAALEPLAIHAGKRMVIIRPPYDDAQHGLEVAEWLLTSVGVPGAGQPYPWHELAFYPLRSVSRRAALWALRLDPRGVCSVYGVARALRAGGIAVGAPWGGMLDPELVTPGDLGAQGWPVIYASPASA